MNKQLESLRKAARAALPPVADPLSRMSPLEILARIPWLHYWEQRLVGLGFYRHVRSRLRQEGILRPGLRVLEVGCGQGILANWFNDGHYVGIDTDLESLRFASSRLPRRYFLSANAAKVPFPNETFDAVLSVGVLHHLNHSDLLQHFQELLRVLKRGGKMTVFDSLKPEKRDFLRYQFSALERGEHMRTEEELRRVLLQSRIPPFNLTRFDTLLLQNYTLTIQKT